MKIDVLTIFPEMFSALNYSILSRAQSKNYLQINVVDIRNFSTDKHKKTDDVPYGGGAGMVMTCQPLFDAINSVKSNDSVVCYLSPKGKTLNQTLVEELSQIKHLILVCGHYEGIDERLIEIFNMKEISIGDYVLTGGELPAMVLIDTVSRYVPNVLKEESIKEESFANGFLEYPHYTKPREFMGQKVPEVLFSGNHQEIEKWRKEQSFQATKERRPDLLKK